MHLNCVTEHQSVSALQDTTCSLAGRSRHRANADFLLQSEFSKTHACRTDRPLTADSSEPAAGSTQVHQVLLLLLLRQRNA
jgi:hypothetical protein